ncbi:MAG: ion transporter [Devosiaceae bacterium]|nr:ion transporter [Devosiaceae bacterium MH13]
MRERVEAFITSRRFEIAITALIIINAVTLGLETSQTVMDRFGPVLMFIDRFVLWIFVAELVLRFYVYRTRFFHDPWRVFDFVIVGIALMPATGSLSVLRALRILRVLRLVSMVPSLRRVVGGLVAALPGMGSITVLLTLIFYVFSVIATKLYGTRVGACEAIPGRCAELVEWFGTLPASAYSLFQIMTLESWSMGIVRPVMEVYPNAWAFFLPFILCTTFTVLNLFIGIIVSAMQAEHEATAEEERAGLSERQEELLSELKALRAEVAEMRAEGAPSAAPSGGSAPT